MRNITVNAAAMCAATLGPHGWIVASFQSETYREHENGVSYEGTTGNLIVTAVCPACERAKTFVTKPLP